MQAGSWRFLIEVLGSVAIVASLVFVGVEMRQSRAIAIGEGNLANAELVIQRNDAISEHSLIWTRGNQGEALTADETAVFENLVDSAAIHSFMEYARLQQVEFDEAAQFATAQFSILLFHHPHARQVWKDREAFQEQHFPAPSTYTSWRDQVRSNLARLDRQLAQ